MVNNISKSSSALRLVLGLTLLLLFVTNTVGGILGLALLSISGVLIISGFSRSSLIVLILDRYLGAKA
jgi:hypothetical protein